MYDWDLQVVPGPPKADLKRQALEEWLSNPFLDDDISILALRLGASTPELVEALQGLCDTGFLKPAGGGYALALDLGGASASPGPQLASGGDTASPPGPLAASISAGHAAVELAALSGAVVTDPAVETDGDGEEHGLLDLLVVDDRADTLTREIGHTLACLLPGQELGGADLMEVLPFGLIVLRPTGALEMANARAAALLGVPLADLDGATFEIVTGVNPLSALDQDEPLTFSLTDPALEVSLHGQHLGSGTVILALLRDVSLLEEVSQIQAEAQEELYERLKVDMVDPLVMIERFLEHPDADGLVQARAAMEQINWFLQEFFLRGRDGSAGPGRAQGE